MDADSRLARIKLKLFRGGAIAAGGRARLLLRRPRDVVAGGGRALVRPGDRAGRAVGVRRAGHVGEARLLPYPRHIGVLARQDVGGVGQPAAPAGRHSREFGFSVVDHPTPLRADRGVDDVADSAVVFVAEFVIANELAATPGIELRSESRAVPPRENADQVVFEGHGSSPRVWDELDYGHPHRWCPGPGADRISRRSRRRTRWGPRPEDAALRWSGSTRMSRPQPLAAADPKTDAAPI